MKDIWYERNPLGLTFKYVYKHECYIIADLCDEIVEGDKVDITDWEKDIKTCFIPYK